MEVENGSARHYAVKRKYNKKMLIQNKTIQKIFRKEKTQYLPRKGGDHAVRTIFKSFVKSAGGGIRPKGVSGC